MPELEFQFLDAEQFESLPRGNPVGITRDRKYQALFDEILRRVDQYGIDYMRVGFVVPTPTNVKGRHGEVMGQHALHTAFRNALKSWKGPLPEGYIWSVTRARHKETKEEVGFRIAIREKNHVDVLDETEFD